MEAVVERPKATVDKQRQASTTKEKSIKERTKTAAKCYLEHRGYDIRSTWESREQYGFIAKDEDVIAFVRLVSNGIEKEEFSEGQRMTREDFEQMACKLLAQQEYDDLVNMPVRFDILSLKVLCADRALIRHHINALDSF